MCLARRGEIIKAISQNFSLGDKMKKKLNEPILAEGEATGHFHRLKGDVDVYEENNVRSFENNVDVPLTHEEHKTIVLPPNHYESGIVLEFDPAAQEARQVRD